MHYQHAGTGRACSSASGLKADTILVDEKERHAEEYNMRIYAWKFPAELETHDHPDGPWQVVGGEMDWAADGLGLRAPGGTYNRGVPPARPLVPCIVLLSYLTEARIE